MRKSETYRSGIKSRIVRAGMTMTEVVDYPSNKCGWSCGKAVELADALGYDIMRRKRGV